MLLIEILFSLTVPTSFHYVPTLAIPNIKVLTQIVCPFVVGSRFGLISLMLYVY